MIEQISIHNFKSIREVRVDLSPVTVLIGRSGTGKSTFLLAIRFVRDYLIAGNAAVPAHGTWRQISPAAAADQPLSISLRFKLEAFDSYFVYELGFSHQDRREQRLQLERFMLGDRVLFEVEDRKWTVEPSVTTRPDPGQGAVLGKLPTMSEAVLAFTALTDGIGWHDLPGSVLCHPEPNTMFGNQMRLDGLSDNAGNYLEILGDITRNLRDRVARKVMLERMQQLNPSVTSVELNSIQKPEYIVVGHKAGDQVMPLRISQESGGFRRFFAHLLALYQTPPRQVLMFEEPENGIYPGAMSILAEELGLAPTEGRGQVILATHSPGLLDHFSDDEIRVVELDAATHETRIGGLAAEQRESLREHLLLPGELFTADPARIEEQEREASGS
ncbi:MAG: AAA family ATPase [Phycisphaeraceae bacterium]